MSLNELVLVASEQGEPAINPWVVGGGTLVLLLALLGALLAFAGGRDHS